ncbi:unnamed protein product [Paramecium octaurelia]|uniref:Uncharacterized protein n=1 Tax=Paramecium octaurelia TaxID=43137 RepID=A0A8S1X2V1_PAROT|nr:unnamed protein product [Paramecium octaurelia]
MYHDIGDLHLLLLSDLHFKGILIKYLCQVHQTGYFQKYFYLIFTIWNLKKTQINYDSATFNTICHRKHLLKDITYFLYIIDDNQVGTKSNQSYDKYQLELHECINLTQCIEIQNLNISCLKKPIKQQDYELQTLKRKFTYKNYTQHQATYEIEDEQKIQ